MSRGGLRAVRGTVVIRSAERERARMRIGHKFRRQYAEKLPRVVRIESDIYARTKYKATT